MMFVFSLYYCLQGYADPQGDRRYDYLCDLQDLRKYAGTQKK